MSDLVLQREIDKLTPMVNEQKARIAELEEFIFRCDAIFNRDGKRAETIETARIGLEMMCHKGVSALTQLDMAQAELLARRRQIVGLIAIARAGKHGCQFNMVFDGDGKFMDVIERGVISAADSYEPTVTLADFDAARKAG